MERIINKEHTGIILRQFLKSEMKISSTLLKKLKKDYYAITVNGEHKNVDYILKTGDRVKIDISRLEKINENIKPSEIDIDIIYEDENITVVNKKAGMPTHPSLNHYEDTLANALAYKYKDKPYVFRVLNRLDKDTSGVVVTANNTYTASLLSDQMQNGKVQKTYIAIVKGKLEGSGIINAPINRLNDTIIKRGVSNDGSPAITEYVSLIACDEISVILAKPKTGRTHQLRVHFSHIGHAILGDSLYGEKSDLIARQALHAKSMEIEDIGRFFAPIPQDMEKVIRRYFGNVEFIS